LILRTLGYYDDFVCIGGACQNSCCIGWELDIDEATCDYYRSLPGPFGDRLRAHMAAGSFRDEDCHTFCLTVDGRCPLLNADGLCDIVLTLGPEALCEICSEYPRYTFELGDAVEKSLTISCEEAARLLSVPPGTVKSRVSRAREKLKQLFGPSGELSSPGAVQDHEPRFRHPAPGTRQERRNRP
jgi:hypothetical protein